MHSGDNMNAKTATILLQWNYYNVMSIGRIQTITGVVFQSKPIQIHAYTVESHANSI